MSVPDHEGRNGMWGAPHEPGYCVLDGVRAALNYERLGLSTNGAGRSLGIFRRRSGLRVGGRDVAASTPRNSTSSGRCSAHRSATSATHSAG